MRKIVTSTVVMAAFFISGCGEESSTGDVRLDQRVIGGDSQTDGGVANDGSGPVGPTEKQLRLSYIKQVTPNGGGTPRLDLVAYDFVDDEEINLTAGQGDGGVDCATSLCRLNSDMTWVGWIGTGGSLKVAPVDIGQKRIRIEETRVVAERLARNFEFTEYVPNPDTPDVGVIPQIVYSQGQQMGGTGTIDVYTEPVAGYDEANCGDASPNCKNLAGVITTNGGFRVTSEGSLIILIETTLSTMTLKFFNIGTTAQQTLYTFGEQNQTGSQFSGRLPIGLSPDAGYLAVFTNDSFLWRLNTLQAVPSPPPPQAISLFEGETHPDGDCRRMGNLAFNEVRFNPVFSSDSEWIYFLAHGPCSRRGDPPTNRDDYDILRVNRLLEGDVENVTNNLRASHWSNHNIGDFALSKDGTKIAFTAERMNNVGSKAIWVIDPETGAYDCTRKDPLPVLDGRERCEFISDDSTGADATYRDLRFHIVDVPR
ncbi:MAG: hypothetical protein VYA30_05460 [Myxococcota bacterium]|nr:hypothetical protein [Myxococcota bacterium]